MNDFRPLVSVIIPTHNRVRILKRTLEALARQAYPADRMEVIVVADACTDRTLEMLDSIGLPFSVKTIEETGIGPGGARNSGFAHAQGELLLFLDDDVVPTPTVVTAHVCAHQRLPASLVIGPYPALPIPWPSFLHILTRFWWASKFNSLNRNEHRNIYQDVLGGNLSLASDLFYRLGGFDPELRHANEDHELGLRAIKSGISIAFASNALAYHYDHETTTVRTSLVRAYHEGQALVKIGRKHPELRDSLRLAGSDHESRAVERFVRRLALSGPRSSEPSPAGISARLLGLLEELRLRGLWSAYYGLWRHYYYWRGVSDELGGYANFVKFVGVATTIKAQANPDLDLDLAEGLAAARQLIDSVRPSSMRLRYGKRIVGYVPSVPGAEPLRGAHLHSMLHDDFAEPLAAALAAVNSQLLETLDPCLRHALRLYATGHNDAEESP